MHDLNAFRTNLDAMAERLASRGFLIDTQEFRTLDAERRAALTETERLKAERNKGSAEIAQLRKAGEDTSARQSEVRAIGERIAGLDEVLKAAKKNVDAKSKQAATLAEALGGVSV